MDSLRFSRGDYVSRALLTVHISFVLILNESISSRLAIYCIVNYHYLEDLEKSISTSSYRLKRNLVISSPYLFYRTIYFKFPSQFWFRCIIVLEITNIFEKWNDNTMTLSRQRITILTIRATKSVLKGSAVTFGIPAGSQTAISCSSLYATCSARSLLLRSSRSSLVSTRTGGGVSLGSYKK